MFLVNEDPQIRDNKIRRWLKSEPSVSLIIATANFEWTVSRAVILLSPSTNRELRIMLEKVYGIERYKDFWRDEVSRKRMLKTLPEIVKDWQGVLSAFESRNKVVHGRDRCTRNMASPKVEVLLNAASEIRDYCNSLGGNFQGRLPIRRK